VKPKQVDSNKFTFMAQLVVEQEWEKGLDVNEVLSWSKKRK
jgi:hypothetical protein